VLTCVSQCTQVLSMNGKVTISLIPLMVGKIKEAIGYASYIGCGHSKKSLKAVGHILF